MMILSENHKKPLDGYIITRTKLTILAMIRGILVASCFTVLKNGIGGYNIVVCD